MCCAVCERACTVDTLSTEAETLNNAARWAGLPLLHLLRQVGRNADDAMCWPKYTTCSQQTAPAGAISVALPFSLRLFCKPLPYLSFHFFFCFCFLKKAQLYVCLFFSLSSCFCHFLSLRSTMCTMIALTSLQCLLVVCIFEPTLPVASSEQTKKSLFSEKIMPVR